MPSYDAGTVSSASPATIWRLLVDARTWPTWTPVDELVVERSSGLGADGGRSGVGTVQAFRTGDVVTSECITELVPERRFCYEDAVNFAMHDYRAVVELTPGAGGTVIRWRGTYGVSPGLEAVLPDYLQGVMQQHVDGLAARAEGIERRPPQPVLRQSPREGDSSTE